MIITDLVKNQTKVSVYIDYEYAFALYPKEIDKYNLEINQPIDGLIMEKIKEKVIKRGVAYSYNLLAKKNYTSHEIKAKLCKSGLNEKETELIVNHLTDRGYINDMDYIKRYFENNSMQKSYKQMVFHLRNKGIDVGLINNIIVNDDFDECKAAERIIIKRLKGKHKLSFEERSKLYQYLASKGFKSDTIKKVMANINILGDE